MKQMNTLKKLLVLALLLPAAQLQAQNNKQTVASAIAAQDYVFSARSAQPLNASDINRVMSRMPGYTGGGTINLAGSSYDLIVKKDSVVAYLPYYGRSYTAKIGGNPDDSGIKFKSKSFGYTVKDRKKGGWQIEIKPKDVKDNYIINMTVGTTGNATLVVTSNNQQSITFDGTVTAAAKPKDTKDSKE